MTATVLLTACTLNWRGSEQDYDIRATMGTPDCSVTIQRTEVRAEKKADASAKRSDD